jgi:dephospho-CoA kinase
VIVLGLTGSMAAGKSTIVHFLRQTWHIPVWDADQAVRETLALPEVQQLLQPLFPEAFPEGAFDRQRLRSLVFDQPELLLILESILYPYLLIQIKQFIQRYTRLRLKLVVLDVPLLFETGWNRFCDNVLVVSCRPFLQEKRILRRTGMTKKQMANVLAKQWGQIDKKALANFVIQTDHTKGETFRQLKQILDKLL